MIYERKSAGFVNKFRIEQKITLKEFISILTLNSFIFFRGLLTYP